MASRIHSASGGVSASQALDDEVGGFNTGYRPSGAMVADKGHTSGEQDVDFCKSMLEKEFRKARHSCLDLQVLAAVRSCCVPRGK